jgi:hypothetical protein
MSKRKLSIEEKLARLKLLVYMCEPFEGEILQSSGLLSSEQLEEAKQLIEKYEKEIEAKRQ